LCFIPCIQQLVALLLSLPICWLWHTATCITVSTGWPYLSEHPFVNSSPSCKQPDMTKGTCLYEYPWLDIVKYFVETL
jgi:hypothetical protein